MKLSKKLETEILELYHKYWNAYLNGKLRTMSILMDENCTVIGSGQGEVFSNRKTAIKYYTSTSEQITGKLEMRNRKITISPAGSHILISEENEFFVLMDSVWTFYGQGRISTLFVKSAGQWKIIHQHGSLPDARTGGGEQLNTDKIREENVRLKDAVKRRTIELDDKNRELEIEASLERVRAVAMGMRKPDDMLDVCKTISLQLESLGVKEIRNVQTAIFYERRGTYMNYEYYAKHNKTFITETCYTNNKLHEEFAQQMLKGKGEFFVTHIEGKEVKNWIAYQKTTNVFIDKYLETASSLNYYWFSLGPVALGISTYHPLIEEEINLFKRFLKVFELAYQRYSDIERAVTQAREAQIEAALERVRSRTMGMQKSDDLKEVIQLVYEQFVHLKINVDHAGFVVDYIPKGDWHFWIADQQEIPSKISHPYFDSVWAYQFNEAKEKGIDFFATNLNFEEKNKFYDELLSYVPGLPDKSKDFYLSCPGLAATTALFDNVSLYIENFSGTPYSDEENNTLLRFGKVFQQTYTRFLDLQKAEAQAKEAQIEAALERVRSRSLAMHHSSELSAVVDTLLREFTNLEFTLTFCIINLIDEENRSNTVWAANPETGKLPESYYMKFEDYPFHQAMWDAWKAQKKNFIYTIEGEEKKIYDEYLYTNTEFRRFPKHVQEANKALKRYVAGFTFFKYSGLQTVSENHISEDELNILERFGRVFEQSYTRFLDLQKAEKQAREALIEACLERVRAKAMAMHKSEDLNQAILTVFEELEKLDLNILRCGIGIIDKESKSADIYTAVKHKKESAIDVSSKEKFDQHPLSEGIFEAWLKQEDFSYLLDGEDLDSYYKAVANTNLNLPQSNSLVQTTAEKKQYFFTSTFQAGNLYVFSAKQFPDEHKKIIKRFTSVLNLTFNRFLDLKKAEAQSRESQIQLALERVRARTMAMQRSEELSETSFVLFQQFAELGMVPNRFFIGTMNEEETMFDVWITEWGGEMSIQKFKVNIEEPLQWKKVFKAWKAHDKSLVVDINGEDLIKWNEYLEGIGFPVASRSSVSRIVNTCAIFAKGFIAITTPEIVAEETVRILERFATVFDGTYTRFLDLKNAEARAREAQIEAALERVRSRTMAMQQSDELAETAAVVFKQLINLRIEPNRIYIGIIKDDSGIVEFWITDEDGSKVSSGFTTNLNENISFKKMFEGWKEQKKSLTINMQGKVLEEYFQHLTKLNIPFKDGLSQKQRIQTTAYFSRGFIGIASPVETKSETIQLLERFAAVFNLTYTRFNDLKQAEAQNKIIQADNDRKTKELEEARQLQLSMLPKELPKLPNLQIAAFMRTATEVGGDYYDFIVQEDGTLNVGFGDATGHGLQAGTMITLMKGLFTSDSSKLGPKEFMSHCTRVIKDIKLGRILMSFSYLKIDDHKIQMTSAGMPPIYYHSKKNNRTEEITIQGMPLGAMLNSSYNIIEKELNSGDTILLLTDGLPEQMNSNQVMFDYSRVQKYFSEIAEKSSEEIINSLVKRADDWRNGTPQTDDITFVVIKVK